ncbi:hypothetical protein [Pseudomonas sp. Leaf129]|uniref:hypothetical protein n=1 Tax=Pseudomonas sp. Leaf129 TaxID=1736268 RepID=UPI000AD7377D|nr:hypothetical protein [Pseudomonas sp. Leaf129]
MEQFSKGMAATSQFAAFCVALSFILGLRWQQGFYNELGFPWLSGYANYLDTMKAGIDPAIDFLAACACGWAAFWVITRRANDTTGAFLAICMMLIPFGDLFASFLYNTNTPNYFIIRSRYQIITSGFFIGGYINQIPYVTAFKSYTLKIVSPKRNSAELLALLMSSIVMIAVADSPNTLGKAAARIAIDTGFSNYSYAIDQKDKNQESWNIVGYSQGNLILARPVYIRNQIQIKISNNISDWVIYPTSPIRFGATP